MGTSRVTSISGTRGSYFFLSYAHSPPLAGTLQKKADPWVRQLFGDLTEAVKRRAEPRSSLAPGFFDQAIPLGANWKTSLAEGLSQAAVFVPLYSPTYFAWSWSGKEWASFMQRAETARVGDPMTRFAPVLWVPVPGDATWPGLSDAIALGAGESSYTENGLQALLRLAPYRETYERIVDRLAARVVDIAENTPLEPSPVSDIDSISSAFKAEGSSAVFTVAVAAPARPSAPADADPASYGSHGADWRPFPGQQEQPLAQYAAVVAEQFDFAVEVLDIDDSEGSFSRHPAVILIDPWYVAGEHEAETLRDLIGKLPPWVLPVLIASPPPYHPRKQLMRRVEVILTEAPAPRSEPARRALSTGVTSLGDFTTLMRSLVPEAERQYLRHGYYVRDSGPVSRPSLTVHPKHAETATSPDPAEDRPDD
jgi:FxsC-like protein